MGLLAWSSDLEQKVKFPWQFVGLALAIVFGAISIYTEFVRESVPKLQAEIVSNEPVLDVREKLPDLEVLYQSQDIAKSGKTLSVLIVKIANRGSADVLGTFYDPKAPVTLKIQGGTFVRSDITETSNDYLKAAVGASRTSSEIQIAPVILETNEWFTLKILALHDLATKPEIRMAGKVAGQHSIEVVSAEQVSPKEGFWREALFAGLWVQVVRFPIYGFGFIAIFGLAIAPPILISEAFAKRRRRKLVARFKAKTKSKIDPADDFTFDRYIANGLRDVREIVKVGSDDILLQIRLKSYFKQVEQNTQSEDQAGPETDRPLLYYKDHMIKAMIKHAFLEERDGTWRAVPARIGVAKAFVEALEWEEHR